MRKIEQIIDDYKSFIDEQKKSLELKTKKIQLELNSLSINEYFINNEINYDEELLEYTKSLFSLDDFTIRNVGGKLSIRLNSKTDSDDFYSKFNEFIIKKYEVSTPSIDELVQKGK